MSGAKTGGWPLSVRRTSFLRTLALLLVFLIGYASSQNSTKDYTNFIVYRIGLKTQEQVQAFLNYAHQQDLDIWRDPSTLPGSTERDADIMVPPTKRIDFINRMKAIGATVATFIPDVQRKINESSSAQLVSRRSGLDTLTDQKYFTFEEIESLLEDLRMMYPSLIQMIPIGSTFENRQMKVVYLSTDHRKSKPAIWIDAGIHAREWIAPAVVLQAIHRLVTDPNAADMLRDVDWYILPVFNPDGYEYSHKVDRMWRKTRSKRPNSKCFGVDANRNFDFYWKENGASSNPCSDTFAGPTSFSEKETVNVREFLLQNKDKIKAYLTYHSYGKYLLYPWGYTYDLPENSQELDKLAHDVNKAMVRAGSQPYKIGSSTNVLYPAAGGSDDWAKGVANISLAYTIELPGYGFGFQLPPQYITDVSNHVFAGLREFAKHVTRSSRPNNQTDSAQSGTADYRPKPAQSRPPGAARPTPQKPFFVLSYPNRERPSRPQFTPANTFYVPQAFPYPYSPYHPSDVWTNYNPQDPFQGGFAQRQPSVKTQSTPSDGNHPQQPASNQPTNPTVQSTGNTGVQTTTESSGPAFKSFRRPQPASSMGSNQPARPASPARDHGTAGSTGVNNQNSRPALSHAGTADSSGYSQDSRPAASHYDPTAGSSQSRPIEPSGSSQSQPASSQYQPAGHSQSWPASSHYEPAGPSQSRPAFNQYESSQSRPAANLPIDFGQSAGAQNDPAVMPSAGTNLNPAFGAVFDSNVPTSGEPYHGQLTGGFSFPSSGQFQAEPISSNAGSISFPDPQDEPRPLIISSTGEAADLVSAMDSAPFWE